MRWGDVLFIDSSWNFLKYLIVLCQKNILPKPIDSLGKGKWIKKIVWFIFFLKEAVQDYIESIRFFTLMMKKDFETISSQAIGKHKNVHQPTGIHRLKWMFLLRNYMVNFLDFQKYKLIILFVLVMAAYLICRMLH